MKDKKGRGELKRDSILWLYIILEEIILICVILFALFGVKDKIVGTVMTCIVVFITIANIISKNDITMFK